MSAVLRSSQWFDGDDEVALAHRVAVRMAGASVEQGRPTPVVMIVDTSSEFNPCNLPLRALAEDVRRGVQDAGGVPLVAPAMSLGEDLMKPSAMLYRNLLSIEVEELLRANPVDGVVLLVNCDKTVPGALLGAISADLPTIVVIGGSRPAPLLHGRRLGTGTDLWDALHERRAGRMDDIAWREFESAYACGNGTCNTAGTATSMAIATEALGFVLPGGSSVQAGTAQAHRIAEDSGRRVVGLVAEGLTSSRILSEASLRNAARAVQAIGGSTNAVIHLAAIGGRAGIALPPQAFADAGRDVPVLADLEPVGRALMADFDREGGLPALLHRLGDRIEPSLTVSGDTLDRHGAPSPAPRGRAAVIRSLDDPVAPGPAIRCVSGSLAPDGAVIKAAASDRRLWRHRGPALVFRGYDEMRARVDDPDLPVTADHVLVLTGCGPVGVPGMPEWGMIPIPRRLAQAGVRDMVRVTDARMSGTSFGTVVLHCAPEAAVGGPLALVEDGDIVRLDVEAGLIELEVDDAELASRRARWRPPPTPHLRGWPLLYREHVQQADRGADLDFLTAPTPAHRRRVDPVVGRS